jgi:hypothetical protein
MGPYELPLEVAPGQATTPAPEHQAPNISITPILSWLTVLNATTYSIYLNKSGAFVGGDLLGTQAGTSIAAGTLSYDTRYYWRVDTTNAYGTTTGTTWYFQTEPTPTVGVHYTLFRRIP